MHSALLSHYSTSILLLEAFVLCIAQLINQPLCLPHLCEGHWKGRSNRPPHLNLLDNWWQRAFLAIHEHENYSEISISKHSQNTCFQTMTKQFRRCLVLNNAGATNNSYHQRKCKLKTLLCMFFDDLFENHHKRHLPFKNERDGK